MSPLVSWLVPNEVSSESDETQSAIEGRCDFLASDLPLKRHPVAFRAPPFDTTSGDQAFSGYVSTTLRMRKPLGSCEERSVATDPSEGVQPALYEFLLVMFVIDFH